MKNWLDYFYGINNVDIHQNDYNYYFEMEEYYYEFFWYKNDLKELNIIYEFSQNLRNNGIYCHEIVMTLNQQLFVDINNKNYVLLKSYKNLNKKIEINDILYFSNMYVEIDKLRCDDWKHLWQEKMDYFEYQLNQFGNEHPIARESFAFYAGFVETAIQLLNGINLKTRQTVVAHRRINESSTLYDLYNPFDLVIDHRIRDIAEYYKTQLFQKKNILDEIRHFLDLANLEPHEYKLFFIRMLYPTFYFDEFENVMNYINDESNLKRIIKFSDYYEKIISEIYYYVLNFTDLPPIEWLLQK
jgi:hypothetical protein